MTQMSTRTFDTVVLGDRAGYVAVAFGRGQHRNARGVFDHRHWTPSFYRWPDEAEQMHADVARETAVEPTDVYVSPAVRFTDKRRKGDALPPQVCWADLDDAPADGGLFARLDPFVVASGQHGHTHIYVPLSEPVPLSAHAALNKALAAALGGDAKWSDESLLRLPGTLNHKTDPPAPVVAEVESWGGTVWAPGELAALLGISLGDGLAEAHSDDSRATTRHLTAVSSVPDAEAPPEPLPGAVRRALETPETDRSIAHARLVGACYDAGLTQGQAVAVVTDYGPSRDKYGDKLVEEVARMWGKVLDDRIQPAPIRPLGESETEPDRFFDPRTGARVVALAQAVDDIGPTATDEAGKLYRYTDGAWHGDGERVVTSRLVALTGDRYRRAHTTNVLDVLRSAEPRFTEAGLDTQFLNLPNGLLEWSAGVLHPHDPDVPNLSRIPVEWHPDATCPVIDAWIAETFPGDAVEFVHELIGYAMYNGNPLHIAILLSARGRNGKGTLLRLIGALIGWANVSAVTPQALDEDRFRAAELHGKLANLVGDVDPKAFKATETFKQVTGGDRIIAERKYGQPFSFTCRALMIASFNSLPRTADTTEGFFSRWLVLPFPRHFSPEEVDTSLEERMRQAHELQGLLAHAVRGLQRVMRRGAFAPPESVSAATREFRETADPVRGFLAEATVGDRDAWMPRTSLYAEWQRWADEHGHHAGSAAKFYERVGPAAFEVLGHPLEPAIRQGTRGLRGCRLTRFNQW